MLWLVPDLAVWLTVSMALWIWISSIDNETAHRQKGVWKDILIWQCAFDTTRSFFAWLQQAPTWFSAVSDVSAFTECRNIRFWAILLEDVTFGEFALIWCDNIDVWRGFSMKRLCLERELLKELVTCEFKGLAVSNHKFETFGLMVWLKELKPRQANNDTSRTLWCVCVC